MGALEGRGVETAATAEIVFDKIGWGRWDARKRGDPPRPARTGHQSSASGEEGETGVFMHSEEDDVEMSDVAHGGDSETETSESGSAGSEDDEDEDEEMADEDDDVTDEEDWAQIGAEVLRRYGGSPLSSDGWSGSYGGNSPGQGWNRYPGGYLSVPLTMKESLEQKRTREEREAVEALVKLSSV